MKESYIHIGELRSYPDDSFVDEHRGKLRILLIPLILGILVISWMLLLNLGWIEF